MKKLIPVFEIAVIMMVNIGCLALVFATDMYSGIAATIAALAAAILGVIIGANGDKFHGYGV